MVIYDQVVFLRLNLFDDDDDDDEEDYDEEDYDEEDDDDDRFLKPRLI